MMMVELWKETRDYENECQTDQRKAETYTSLFIEDLLFRLRIRLLLGRAAILGLGLRLRGLLAIGPRLLLHGCLLFGGSGLLGRQLSFSGFLTVCGSSK